MEQRVIILAKSRTGMKATRARVSETPQLMRFAVRHTYIYAHIDAYTQTQTPTRPPVQFVQFRAVYRLHIILRRL